MRLREAAKGIVTAGDGTYRIGFNNGDETEFTAFNLAELEELYHVFCKEEGIQQDTVDYVERVG